MFNGILNKCLTKTRTKFYISEQHHPKKVLPEYIQILAIAIRHTTTNRDMGFSKIFDSARVL